MKAAVVDTAFGGDVFERARRAGFSGVELSVGRDSPPVAAGLAVPTLILAEHNEGGIASADPSVADAAAEDVQRAIGWAVDVGADVILVPFLLRAELRTDDDVERCTAAFRKLCPLAAERGVSLCYEGTLPAERVLAMADRIGSPAFGCYFDLANPLVEGLDPATEVRQLAPLVRRVHVKDSRVTRGDVRVGLGRVDFAECARALEEIGYDGWLVLESRPGPWELAARDLAFARSMFPAVERPEWPRFGVFAEDLAVPAEASAVQLAGPLLDECLEDPSRADALQGVQVVALAGYANLLANGQAVERLRRCLEIAPLLGTSIVATHGGTRNVEDWHDAPENRDEETRRAVADALEELLPVAEEHGSILALEAHVNTALKTPGHLLELLDRFATEHLQLVCDPYNFVSRYLLPAQERVTADLLERFEHRFVLAHLKDVDPGGAEAGSPAFGTGVFSQRPYLEFLRERRSDLPLVLEHLPLDEVPAAIERVRSTVG